MALATRCPHCETAFRVASDQLKLRAGLVRCGTCNQIFNGIENLLPPDEDIPPALAAFELPPPDAPLPVPVDETPPRETALQDGPAVPDDGFVGHATALEQSGPTGDPSHRAFTAADEGSASASGGTGLLPAEWPAPESRLTSTAPTAAETHVGTGVEAVANTGPRSDGAQQREALWMAVADTPPRPELASAQPRSAADTAEPTYADVVSTQKPVENATDVRDDELDRPADDGERPWPADVLSRPDTIPSMAGLLRAARIDDDGVLTRPSRMSAQQPKAKPATDVKPAPEIADLPDFVVRDQKKQGRYRAWQPVLWAACGLLGVVLILQSIYATRTTLAANFPQTRRILETACSWLGCGVGLPMQIESVSIESSDFQPVDGNRDLFLLTVLLRNRGTTVQGWPCIELTLNDATDKAVGRRVITPREYLPPGQNVSNGIATGAEQPVTLYFDLTQIKALGYRVYLFYP